MAEIYPALTIWQPWGTLIAEEAKPWEFRGYAVSPRFQRRRIAIHAGARPIRRREVRVLLAQLHSSNWRETGLLRSRSIEILEKVLADPTAFPLSSILCTAMLGEPLTPEQVVKRMPAGGLVNDSDRAEHCNFAWPLTEVRRLQPIVPATGQQGFWSIKLEAEA